MSWPTSEPDNRPTERPGALVAFIALLGAAVVLAGLVSWAALRTTHASAEVTAPENLDSAARTALVATTGTLTTKALSYGYVSLPSDMAQAERGMTTGFKRQYLAAMSKVRAQTQENKITLKAMVVGTSLISANDQTARALVFVDQVTSRAGTKQTRLDQNRVVVTLVRVGEDWQIAKMDVF